MRHSNAFKQASTTGTVSVSTSTPGYITYTFTGAGTITW
jgi:hypothetical protein